MKLALLIVCGVIALVVALNIFASITFVTGWWSLLYLIPIGALALGWWQER